MQKFIFPSGWFSGIQYLVHSIWNYAKRARPCIDLLQHCFDVWGFQSLFWIKFFFEFGRFFHYVLPCFQVHLNCILDVIYIFIHNWFEEFLVKSVGVKRASVSSELMFETDLIFGKWWHGLFRRIKFCNTLIVTIQIQIG